MVVEGVTDNILRKEEEEECGETGMKGLEVSEVCAKCWESPVNGVWVGELHLHLHAHCFSAGGRGDCRYCNGGCEGE